MKVKIITFLALSFLFLAGCSYKIVKVEEQSNKAAEAENVESKVLRTPTSTVDNLVESKSTTTATASISQPPSKIVDKGRHDDLIIHYAQSLVVFKEHKTFFDSTKPIIELRIDHIKNRINIFKAGIMPEFIEPEKTGINYEIRKWNEIVNLYIEIHSKDLVRSDATFNINEVGRKFVDARIESYDKAMSFYLNNPNEVVDEKTYSSSLESTNLFFSTLTKAKEAVNFGMGIMWDYDSTYKDLDYKLSLYKDKLVSYFSAEKLKYEAYNSTSRTSYSAIPQPSVNTFVRCTIDHTRFQSFVTCY
ncbi:MAG: hypothetical protein WCW02_00585 [Candidatus Buchananbacteria bacterium]